MKLLHRHHRAHRAGPPLISRPNPTGDEESRASPTTAAAILAAADPSGADWAARQGLPAYPGNEILYRDRMIAADAAGNPARVHAAMAELCDVLETDDRAHRVHPDTLALYEELTSKWAKHSTG
ncbi:MAG: hypothetical protein AB1679_14475 [Actinomycetota bacterium]